MILSESFLNLKFEKIHIILCLIFCQINEDDEIRTRDRLIIKILIPYQRIISI
jgi:hypothetical protein